MIAPPPRPLVDVVAALTRDTDPYLSCDDCFDRLCAYVERRAGPFGVDVAMQNHLLGCPACADEAAALAGLLDGAPAEGPGSEEHRNAIQMDRKSYHQ